jgi:hypothetical protein
MFIGPAALATSPALIRSSQGSPVIGTRRATGWPRSVISIDSPAATSSRYLLACCRNSRTPIVFMCYMVAHVITDQPPRRFAIPDKRPLPPGFDSLDYVSIIDYEYAMLRNMLDHKAFQIRWPIQF